MVSTDCPIGPREILDGGRFGPLVPVGDVAVLARAIERMLDHPPAAESVRPRAALFSVQRSADRYLELLRQDALWRLCHRTVPALARSKQTTEHPTPPVRALSPAGPPGAS